jgi:hypothetical protein
MRDEADPMRGYGDKGREASVMDGTSGVWWVMDGGKRLSCKNLYDGTSLLRFPLPPSVSLCEKASVRCE